MLGINPAHVCAWLGCVCARLVRERPCVRARARCARVCVVCANGGERLHAQPRFGRDRVAIRWLRSGLVRASRRVAVEAVRAPTSAGYLCPRRARRSASRRSRAGRAERIG